MAKRKIGARKERVPETLDPVSLMSNPHDKYVRFVLQSYQVAIELIQFALPPGLYETIDPESIELSADSFIDEQLKAHYSDVCYTAFTAKGDPLRISIIFEHKSHPPDRPLREQLLRYISGAWAKDMLQQRRLSLIIPILVYHGEPPIEKETTELLFPTAPAGLLPFIPTFDYLMVDIARIPDSIMETLQFRVLMNILWALKYGRNADFMEQNWNKILTFALDVQKNNNYNSIFKATFLYMSAISSTFNAKIKNMDTAFTESEQNIIKPYIIELYEEGMEQGKQQGIEQGIEQGIAHGIEIEKIQVVLAAYKKGLSVELIAEIVKISVKEVELLVRQAAV